MLKKIGLTMVVLLLVFVVVIALQPSEFRVSRSTTIAAPPATVFPLVNNFHAWDAWSPWAKLDPAMKTTYSGPDSGKGAAYSWVGNSDVGEGEMTISESVPNEKILIDLAFKVPFEATNVTEFRFDPEGEGTQVTWTMTGINNFMGKAIGLFMDMDTMVGDSFEQGLAAMKTIAEAKTTEATEAPAPTE